MSLLSVCAVEAGWAQPPEAAGELVVAPGQRVELAAPEPGGRVEAVLDGGVLAPVSGSVAAPGSGDHWLAVAFRDGAGNPSPVRWVRLRVDGEPPAVELTADPPWSDVADPPWVAAGARVVARAGDDLAGVASTRVACGETVVESEGDEAACTVAAGPSGAPVRLAAGAVDRVGNRAAPRRWEMLLDAGAPRVAVRAVGPTARSEVGLVLGAAARLEVTGSDAESGVAGWSHRLDGAEVTGYDDLAWGPHRAEPVAVDRAGNRSADEPFFFFFDDRPPLLEAELGAAGRADVGDVLYLRPPVEIRLTARDVPAGLAALEWATAGGPWRDLAAAAVASGAEVEMVGIDAVGVRTAVRTSLRFAGGELPPRGGLRFAAVDRVGNRSRITLLGGWRLDREAPRITLPGAAAAGGSVAVAAGAALEVEVDDAGSGVAAARWRVDGGAWHDLDGPVRLSAAGERRLEVEAEDRVGNRGAAARTVRVARGGGS